jgi:hypothetical protein
MVLAQPPLLFSSPATAHLLPPGPAQSTHRYTCPFSQLVRFLYYRTCPIRPSLADRWVHPVSEPGRLLPPEARLSAATATSPVRSRCPRRPLLSHGKTNRCRCSSSPTPRFASEFCSNYNLALNFRFYLISNPWTLHFSP